MKVLFVYKYLTLGGVEAVLRARLEELPAHGVSAEAWFFHDFGGRGMFSGLEAHIHVGDVQACLAYAAANEFDVLSTIDTEEVLQAPKPDPFPPSVVLECHSGYLQNIEYLRQLGDSPPVAVFAPSEPQRQLIRERAGDVEVSVVPNPLQREMVGPLRDFVPLPPLPVMAWVGRLDQLKNWEGFLEAGQRVLRTGPEVEIWLVGGPVDPDGPQHLRLRAAERGVLGNMRWFAGLPHARMPTLLDAVRGSGGLVVVTSRRESFGLSVAEAMARGCAVVAPRQPPFTDLLGESTGLYRPGSMAAAADCARRLLTDADLRAAEGHRGRASAIARFSPAITIAALAAELKAIVRARHSAAASPATPPRAAR